MQTNFFPQQLAIRPDAMAITDLTQQRSWRELDRNIAALANFLIREIGARPGDHMALLIGNRVEYIEAMLAGMLAGLWVTPINTHLTASEVSYIRDDCGASVVFYDPEHQHLLLEGSGTALNVCEVVSDLHNWLPETAVSNSAPAGGNMLYTSGTTGKPKGVQRAKATTVGEMIERMRNTGEAFGLTGRGPHLVTGPLYHAAPGMFALYDLMNGAPMVIMPKWDCDTFFRCVREYQVATTHLVPTMFVRLLDARHNTAERIDLSSLRYVLHGAAPITRPVKESVLQWFGPLLTEYWGATESGVVTLVNSEEWLKHPGTVGRAVGSFSVYVGDEHGNPSDQEEGLLFCRHAQLPLVFSYHKDPQKTLKAHPRPHIFYLGDIGQVDSEGFVYLSDRESHMIISGGVNIYPSEVEQALLEHADVTDAAVFGIPNPEWGEEVKAVVELRTGASASTDQLRDFLRGKIASFKIPRSMEFVSELPRTPSGKVQIHKLKAKYLAANP